MGLAGLSAFPMLESPIMMRYHVTQMLAGMLVDQAGISTNIHMD